MAVNGAGTLLCVAEDESDTMDVIDIGSSNLGTPGQGQPATQYKVIETIPVIAPPEMLSANSILTQYTCYNEPRCKTPLAHDPYATHTVVASSADVALMQFTDPYFRGFDPSFPDYYRFKEWERDFGQLRGRLGAIQSAEEIKQFRSLRRKNDMQAVYLLCFNSKDAVTGREQGLARGWGLAAF